MKRTVLLALLFALMLAIPANAALDEEQFELFGAGEVEEAVPDEARDIIGGVGVEDALEPQGMFSRLWDAALEKLGAIWADALNGVVKLVAISALIAACSAFATETSQQYVTLAGCLAVAVTAFGDAGEWINAGAETIESLSEFSRALLPCLTAYSRCRWYGGVGGGKIRRDQPVHGHIYNTEQERTPAFGLRAARRADGGVGAGQLGPGRGRKLIKWVCAGLTTAIMTSFTLYLSLSGAVTGAADAVTSKAAKTAISTVLPVVGGIISDAAGTLVAGAGLLRGAVGVLGAAVIAAICLVPFLSPGAAIFAVQARCCTCRMLCGQAPCRLDR